MRGKTEFAQALVERVTSPVPNVRMITFAMSRPLPATAPGSHIQIEVTTPHGNVLRSYTVVDADQNRVSIAVSAHANSRGGSRYIFSLSEGMEARIGLPENRFPLSYTASDYLLIAGGIGITPLVSMARALKRVGKPVRLAYAGKSRGEMAFVDTLGELLGADLAVFASDEGQRLDIDAEIAALGVDGELYACGPIGLLNDIKAAWNAAGRAPGRLRFEVFGDSGSHAETAFSVSVPALGAEVTVAPDQTMLEALRDAGVEMISECERGECGLCAVEILDHTGEIDHRDVFYSDEEHAENRRLCACVSRVVDGAVVIDVGYRPESAPHIMERAPAE